LKIGYEENKCRQLVLLGAGMDARAWRLHFPELDVYEVDLQPNFDLKENLVAGSPLTVRSRNIVATNFSKSHNAGSKPAWVRDWQGEGFSHEVPTVWLLEGLMMYLEIEDQITLMKNIGSISAQGSLVFHDAISKSYERVRVKVAGVPFLGGSDEYGALWQREGGFSRRAVVTNHSSIYVDRYNKILEFDPSYDTSPEALRGREVVLFVEAEK